MSTGFSTITINISSQFGGINIPNVVCKRAQAHRWSNKRGRWKFVEAYRINRSISRNESKMAEDE